MPRRVSSLLISSGVSGPSRGGASSSASPVSSVRSWVDMVSPSGLDTDQSNTTMPRASWPLCILSTALLMSSSANRWVMSSSSLSLPCR